MLCEDESDDCKRAREEYEDAHQDYLSAVGKVNSTRDNRNASGTVGVVGLVVGTALTFGNGTEAWFLTVGFVGLVGGLVATRQQDKLNAARSKCQSAIRRMYAAFRLAEKNCNDRECIPPRPTQTCP